jgi:hypothetical protein
VRKESKCDWRSVHVIEGEYLKRTMCVIGVEVGREDMDEVEVGVREPMLLDDRSFEGWDWWWEKEKKRKGKWEETAWGWDLYANEKKGMQSERRGLKP